MLNRIKRLIFVI